MCTWRICYRISVTSGDEMTKLSSSIVLFFFFGLFFDTVQLGHCWDFGLRRYITKTKGQNFFSRRKEQPLGDFIHGAAKLEDRLAYIGRFGTTDFRGGALYPLFFASRTDFIHYIISQAEILFLVSVLFIFF